MTPVEFAAKINKAREQFIQELKDGCNECANGGLCYAHGKIACASELYPTQCQEFQDFLKEMGLVK